MYIRHLNAMQFPDTVSERLLPQPYSHKAVVDDITVRRFVDHFPVDQPFEGAVHAAGRPESVFRNEIPGIDLPDASGFGDGFKQSDIARRISRQQVLVRIGRFGDHLSDGIIHHSDIRVPGIPVKPVEQGLDVPCMPVEGVIKIPERLFGQFPALPSEKVGCETIIFVSGYPVDDLRLRTLIERTFGRMEHLLHDMLLAAGEYEIDIRDELDV